MSFNYAALGAAVIAGSAMSATTDTLAESVDLSESVDPLTGRIEFPFDPAHIEYGRAYAEQVETYLRDNDIDVAIVARHSGYPYLDNSVTDMKYGHTAIVVRQDDGRYVVYDYSAPKSANGVRELGHAHLSDLAYHFTFIPYEGLNDDVGLIVPDKWFQEAVKDHYTALTDAYDYTQDIDIPFALPKFSLLDNARFAGEDQNCTTLMGYNLVSIFEKTGIAKDLGRVEGLDGKIDTAEEAAAYMKEYYVQPNPVKNIAASLSTGQINRGPFEFGGIEKFLDDHGVLNEVGLVEFPGLGEKPVIGHRFNKNDLYIASPVLSAGAAGLAARSHLKKRKQKRQTLENNHG